MDKDKSIEVGFYIKRFNDLTSSNLPLLKIYRSKGLYISTMYDIQETKLIRRLHSGRLKKFVDD